MDLLLSAAEVAFQSEVRAFLDASVPSDLGEKVTRGKELSKEDHRRWWSILFHKGWVAPSWPKDAGGTGWTLTQRYIFEQELARTPAPSLMPFGVGMVGPVILEFGTEVQKRKFLPSILDGSVFWCQGFSEPGAGSDLAAVRTSAIRDGDDYVVNGQKIWTSYAHWADWIFCLVRTSNDGKPQEGISFLLIDMKSPGISVCPIETIDDHHHLNEVFFENVRVPVANRIGEENRGWSCAKFLLSHERTGLTGVAETQRALENLFAFANQYPRTSKSALFRRLTLLEARLRALEITELRCLAREEGGGEVGAEASILKLVGTELQQRVSELAVEAMGLYANAYMPQAQKDEENDVNNAVIIITPAMTLFFFRRAATIYGGSDEVQRNVIAKAVLGFQGGRA